MSRRDQEAAPAGEPRSGATRLARFVEISMDRERIKEREGKCIQEHPPACTATCPVHVDVRAMAECVRKGDLSAGLALFARLVPFPRIISRTCDRPCEKACKRREAGEAIRVNDLERACADLADKRPPTPRSLPGKQKRVAVVGAGLSGLSAAVQLALKGYPVVVFEATAHPGGRATAFPEETLPRRAIDADFEILRELGVEVRYESPVGNAEGASVRFDALVGDFDAVYLGPGPDGVEHLLLGLEPGEGGRVGIDPLTFATSQPKVFAGGGQRQGAGAYSSITSLHDGRHAAVSIDRFLQGVSLTASREPPGPLATRLSTSAQGVEPLPAIRPADPLQGYTRTEAVREAERCLSCQCMQCVKACEYLAHYGSYPKRYLRQIYNNDCVVMGARMLNRMVNSCALCGQCEAVCPENLGMGETIREARLSLVKKGKMPPSAHEFALRDMAFSCSEHFTLARHAPGQASSAALFFPGCQLSASSPHHVARIYEHLLQKVPGGVGLHLGCCGAPADWAARQDLFDGALQQIARTWAEMGISRVITACSSCYRVFKDHLPDSKVESLWPLLAHIGLPPRRAPPPAPLVLAVHDPCATRDEADIHAAVREILAGVGVQVEELAYSRELTTCCGYGGLQSFANPEVADKTLARRIAESEADYVTYCAMCRDAFAAKGKRSLHVLALVFGAAGVGEADAAARRGPTFSQRHENRARLKARLLRDLWGEAAAEGDHAPVTLVVSPEVQALMEKRMILMEDVERVVAHAEASGEKIENGTTGRTIARHRPAAVTYWVEYSPEGAGEGARFVVHNAYSHRMQVGPS
jgi:glutamate synthase (NADPH/NADH) small chain